MDADANVSATVSIDRNKTISAFGKRRLHVLIGKTEIQVQLYT